MNQTFHDKTINQSLKSLSSNLEGLSAQEAQKRLSFFGPNKITTEKKISPILVFFRQFKNLFVLILSLAIIVALSFKEFIDALVILIVIIINTLVGFLQEYKAERSIQALSEMMVQYAKVLRDGKLLKILAKDLVPGDIILLEEGDSVPADGRILEMKNLEVQEAILTGESLPSSKITEALPFKTSLADQKNMVFSGTLVTRGEGKILVTATGNQTIIGKIAQDISEAEEKKIPFEEKTRKLAIQMALIAVGSVSLIFLIGFFIRGFLFKDIFLFSLASLVSAIPEGLPAILVIILAVGAHRMAKRNAIIKRLSATQTLGAVTVIATDKTGTLTENTLTVEKIILADQKEIEISGVGWRPQGEFFTQGKKILPLEIFNLDKLLYISALCNNARLLSDKKDHQNYEIIGDPTEASLVVLAEKAGLNKETLEEEEKIIDDLPFNSELKFRASLIEKNKQKEIYVVGAPEIVLKKSNYFLNGNQKEKLNLLQKEKILKNTKKLAKMAMRTLALAYKETKKENNSLDEREINDLIFVGILGMTDLPRKGVEEAIAKTKKAGIRVIMQTGDHKETALAVAKKIGLIDNQRKSSFPLVMTEEELLALSEKDFKKAVKEVSIFARLSPDTKFKIIKTLQKEGEIVAMTGDGVNDAPALKEADIGVSMGIMGTDVARAASDIVLSDDNFVSIVNAIWEGRVIFNNARRASFFLVTINFAEVFTLIISLILGLPLFFLPTQILWLNLVTDTGAGLGLAMEPGHKDTIEMPPRKKEEEILSKDVIPFLFLMVGIMSVMAIFFFFYFLSEGIEKARTAAFVIIAVSEHFNAFNLRSIKTSLFKLGIFSNKYLLWGILVSLFFVILPIYWVPLQKILGFTSLTISEFLVLIFISSMILWVGEIYKIFKKK